MHTSNKWAATLCVLAAALAAAYPASSQERAASLEAASRESPQLGFAATSEQIAGWDISVGPDGEGLPAGSGTATSGAEVYALKCIACHGAEGAGQPNDRLVGGHDTLTSAAPVRTIGSYWPYATTVFDYIRRAMPYTQPQSLSSDEVYALTAYLLRLNGIIGDNDVMNAETLPRVVMPNQGNFEFAYPEWKN